MEKEKEKIYLSIVIPAYNEEKRIKKTLNEVLGYFSKKEYFTEIIVVNDGSNDNTSDVVKEILSNSTFNHRIIEYQKNQGKGYALKQGFLAANGKYILFMDADLATPIKEIENFLSIIENNDCSIVIGTRKTKSAFIEKRQPFIRECMGKVFTFISNIILNTNVSDFTCGFKLFKNEIGKKIFQLEKINSWAFDSEIIFLAKKFNYIVIEQPVEWRDVKGTKVKILKDTIKSFFSLVYIRLIDLFGFYSQK